MEENKNIENYRKSKATICEKLLELRNEIDDLKFSIRDVPEYKLVGFDNSDFTKDHNYLQKQYALLSYTESILNAIHSTLV